MSEPITSDIIDELLREGARVQRKLRLVTYTFVAIVLLIAILA